MQKKKMIKTFAVVFSILMLGILVNMQAYAAIVCVDPMDSGCYNTIQEGINAAVSGDTVEVAGNWTYVEQVTLKGGVTLQGENRDTTIIWNNNHTIIASYLSPTMTIQGFTITSADGNAIYINGYSTITIKNNIIKDSGGRGIYFYAGQCCGTHTRSLNAIDNIIENNNEGIYLTGNQYYRAAGNIWNNTIINNNGNGISLNGRSYPAIANNVILNNLTDGIRMQGTTFTPYIVNNVIMSNGNYGISNSGMTPTVVFNDVYNNTTGDYSGVTIGPGNISIDPEFVDETGKDFHLLPSSPVIDAGNPANAPLDDMDGDPRPLDGDANSTSIHDMGADEYAGCADRDSDSDGIFDDGNCNGITGDNPCTGGNTENCDDNCVYTSNPDQEDVDENGIGDACEECIILGDINEDEIIDISDVILVLRMALELDPYKYICKYLWCPE